MKLLVSIYISGGSSLKCCRQMCVIETYLKQSRLTFCTPLPTDWAADECRRFYSWVVPSSCGLIEQCIDNSGVTFQAIKCQKRRYLANISNMIWSSKEFNAFNMKHGSFKPLNSIVVLLRIVANAGSYLLIPPEFIQCSEPLPAHSVVVAKWCVCVEKGFIGAQYKSLKPAPLSEYYCVDRNIE